MRWDVSEAACKFEPPCWRIELDPFDEARESIGVEIGQGDGDLIAVLSSLVEGKEPVVEGLSPVTRLFVRTVLEEQSRRQAGAENGEDNEGDPLLHAGRVA
jgi:hypothetical protein